MIPDNYDIWEAHDRECERKLACLPSCSRCGRKIHDVRVWVINDELYHLDCAEEEFCKWTEDYTE